MRKRAKKASKGPYNPAIDGSNGPAAQKARAHLGLAPMPSKAPTAEVEELAGGTLRTKHRFLLTTPEARRAAYDEWKAGQLAANTFGAESYYVQRTALDRLLSQSEHDALCWYLRVHVAVNYPKAGGCNYSGDQRGPTVVRMPPNSGDKTLYKRVTEYLTAKQQAILDWLARHEFVLTEYGAVDNHIFKGRQIIDSQDWRRGEGGIEGYVADLSDVIDNWRNKCAAKLKARSA